MGDISFDSIKDDYMRTKQDIQEWIAGAKKRYEKKALTDKEHSAAFYHGLQNLLQRFSDKVNDSVLFEQLEDFWIYTVCISLDGAILDMEHISKIYEDKRISCDQEYRLISVDANMLSVEEYAQAYGVNEGTVRQWIRRGKLRSAVKTGRTWRIPELDEISHRGFESAVYMWSKRLEDLPEKYQFLNHYSTILINQDQNNKEMFDVAFAARGIDSKHERMDTKQRESFELFLIQQPDIHSIGLPDDGLNIKMMRKDSE